MGRKIDAGLHRVGGKRWERFEASSVTVAEFCRREGVSTAAFYRWRKRLRRQSASAEKRTAASLPATRGSGARPQGRSGGFVELAVSSLAVVGLALPTAGRGRNGAGGAG